MGPELPPARVNLETDFEGNSEFNVLADYTMRWINRLGAEWKNQVQIGTTKRIFSEFYQPLVASRFFFIAPHVEWRQEPVNVYTGNDLIAEYRLRTLEGGIDLGNTAVDIRRGENRIHKRHYKTKAPYRDP